MARDHLEALRSRILDHLEAAGFHDDLLYVDAFVTRDRTCVYVTLRAREYGCAACRERGLVRRIRDAVTMRLRKTWCDDCLAATEERWERMKERRPELYRLLHAAFVVKETAPGSPFGDAMVLA